jgi:uncharacterized phage infection (PIP) family protein YhgE
MDALTLTIGISFACFIGVLIFNVYEFRKISKELSKGFHELSVKMSEDHKAIIKGLQGLQEGMNTLQAGIKGLQEGQKEMMNVLQQISINLQNNTKVLERIEMKLSAPTG